jgi:hypothetical protein
MAQTGVCPRCGTIRYQGLTWCSGCGYVFERPEPATPSAGPTASTPPVPTWPPQGFASRPSGAERPASGARRPPYGAGRPPSPLPSDPGGWLPPVQPGQANRTTWGTDAIGPTREDRNVRDIAVAVAALVVGAAVIVAIAALGFSPHASPTVAPTYPVVGVATPTPAANGTNPAVTTVDGFVHFGDGIYLVGVDIRPGTYRAPDAGPGCSWSRISSITGNSTTVAASNMPTGGPDIATVKPGDKAFETRSCGTWTSDLSRITRSKTVILDGTYIVGVDIEPGWYTTEGGRYCLYERMSGFAGFAVDWIDGATIDGSVTIAIQSSDKGFMTSGCATWTRV